MAHEVAGRDSANRHSAAIGALRVALAAAIIVPMAVFFLTAWRSRSDAEHAAEQSIHRTTLILRQHALKAIEAAGAAAEQVDNHVRGLDWNAIGRSPEVHQFLESLDASLVQVSHLRLIDSTGTIRSASDTFPIDRPINPGRFAELRRLAAAGHMIVDALHTSRREPSFDIVRLRSAPGKAFDGIVLVTVAPQYFQSLYDSIIKAHDDSIALVRPDGEVLLRYPYTTRVPQPEYARAIAAGATGVYRARDASGGERLIGFAKLGTHPLYLTYGRSVSSVLDAWYADVRREAILAALAAIALVAIVWSALRRAHDLQRSEERYRTLYIHTPVPMHTLDREARIVSVSEHWLNLLGYTRSEILGRPIAGFLSTRSAHDFRSSFWPQALEGKAVEQAEHEFLRKDREVVVALVSARPERDAEKRVVRIHAVVVDITSRKRAEQALRREKELSGSLLKSSTEGIVGIDRSFRLTLWNEAMAPMTGYEPEAALGRNLLDLFPRFRGTAIEAAWRGALEGRQTEMHERTYVVPATERRGLYEARFAPIYGEEGEIIGAVSFVRDVTERHQMEALLRQSQKMEAVGQLTGGIAHDFNNLLTVIIGNLQLVAGNLPEEAKLRRQVAAAQRAADRGARLTSQLLAFSRRQTLRPEVRDLDELIRDFHSLAQRAAGGAVQVALAMQPNLWATRVDPAQFEAALLNLVVNARDALRGRGVVTIATANVALAADNPLGIMPGDYVRVSVIDAGSGMPPDVLARASEPFFTTKEVGKGTGLGLSMVYGFLRQSGGELRIDSEPEKGTRVDMYLPRSQEAPVRSRAGEGGRPLPYGTGTILVVDDEADIRDAVATMLQELGYEALTAASGEEALHMLRRGLAPDLLFTDIVMPGMSGVELAQAARREFLGLRILLSSGYAQFGIDTVEGERPVLPKPFDREQLGAAVREALLAPSPPVDHPTSAAG